MAAVYFQPALAQGHPPPPTAVLCCYSLDFVPSSGMVAWLSLPSGFVGRVLAPTWNPRCSGLIPVRSVACTPRTLLFTGCVGDTFFCVLNAFVVFNTSGVNALGFGSSIFRVIEKSSSIFGTWIMFRILICITFCVEISIGFCFNYSPHNMLHCITTKPFCFQKVEKQRSSDRRTAGLRGVRQLIIAAQDIPGRAWPCFLILGRLSDVRLSPTHLR